MTDSAVSTDLFDLVN